MSPYTLDMASKTPAPKQSDDSANLVFDKVAENLYRHKSSKKYYALLKRGGKQFRRSLKTKDRHLANSRLANFRRDVANLTLSQDSKASFDDIAGTWLKTVKHTMKPSSVLRRQTCIKNLRRYFRGLSIRNIGAAECDKWLLQRGRVIAPSTFAHELGTMKLVFNFAIDRGLLLDNPARHIKRKPFGRAEILVPTREQFSRLIAAMHDTDGAYGSQGKGQDAADLVELLAYSGCRQAEATTLRWQDVDFRGNCITINGTKSDSSKRTIPMTDALRKLLKKLNAKCERQPAETISQINDAKKCLHTTCRKLGFPQFTHHDFRHFFATTCMESGVDIPTISRWLGHKDGGALAMRVYGHLRQDHSFTQIKRVRFDHPGLMPRQVKGRRSQRAVNGSNPLN
jgi:integrase